MSGHKNKVKTLLNNEGFTLLELIVAMSIGVVLILISGSIMKSSVGLMSRGEKWLQGDFREYLALEFWREQVSAIRADNASKFSFEGAKRELSFVSPVHLDISGGGLVEAHYSIQKEGEKYSLIYSERRLTPAERQPKVGKKGPAGSVLLEGYDEIRFEYLGKVDGNENQWKGQWEDAIGFPRALRLTLVQEKEEKTIIAPIVATSFSSSSGL